MRVSKERPTDMCRNALSNDWDPAHKLQKDAMLMCVRSVCQWMIRLGCMVVFLACSAISGMALEDDTVSRKATENSGIKDAHVRKATEKGKELRDEAQEALKKGQQAVQTGAQKVQEAGKKVLEGGKDAARAAGAKANATKVKVKEAAQKLKDSGRKILEEAGKKLKGSGEKQGVPPGGQLPQHGGPHSSPETYEALTLREKLHHSPRGAGGCETPEPITLPGLPSYMPSFIVST